MKEQHKPYISIVIPVYNAEKYLKECIESILEQTYQDFELILVDDGSKDSSGSICDEYAVKDARIRVFHQPNGGVTSARKVGVEAALAEWIMFVDADDKVTPNGLQRLVDVQQSDKELDIIEGSIKWFYPDGTSKVRPNIAIEKGPVYYNGHDYSFSLHGLRGPLGGPCAKLIRRQIIIDSNALDIPRWITNGEDAMMLTIAARLMRKCVLLPDTVYLYRQQFEITAISNKLSFEYWSDYLDYTHNVVLSGLLPEWDDVWRIMVREYFSLIVHKGYIKTGSMPDFFETEVLPILNTIKHELYRTDAAYVTILNLPKVLRYPVCTVLHGIYTIKHRLL